MIDIKSVTKKKLQELIVDNGYESYRAQQIFSWLSKGSSFDEMKNIPQNLIDHLKKTCKLNEPHLIEKQLSKDGTIKALLGFLDGNAVECVLMKYHYGYSICISSQAGCRMGCKFCDSGKLGLARNLSAGEMLDQVIFAQRNFLSSHERINHIVIMGTGEPFDNFDNLCDFIVIANDKDGLAIGMRNITVSTCGILPKVSAFADRFPQAGLAVSLHHANQKKRASLMPIAARYPLDELIAACKEYTERTSRRITFEYSLIKNENDTDDDITALIKLLQGMLCHVNLIPLNETDSSYDATSRKRAEEISKNLNANGIPATIRRSLGGDIKAACGQLRLRN